MSGYVFHCTPCGFPHSGECPEPVKKAPELAPDVADLTIVVGSRWRGNRRARSGTLVGIWQRSGWPDGYEVLAVISGGTNDTTRIQVRAWNAQHAVVWTLQVEYWFEEGFANPMSGYDERMVPWVP